MGKGLCPVKIFTGHGRIRTRVHNPTCPVKTFTEYKPDPKKCCIIARYKPDPKKCCVIGMFFYISNRDIYVQILSFLLSYIKNKNYEK